MDINGNLCRYNPKYCRGNSISTINLTIDTVVLSVSNNDPLLTANATSATYQWLICPSYTVIEGATYPTYSPMVNGSYACEINRMVV